MKLEQSFDVDAPLERVWEALVNVEHVAPCLPGAAVTGRNEDGSYNGTFTIKIGPTTASYDGKLEMQNVDEASHSAAMHAQGSDKRGQGGATATINSRVTAANGTTHVEVVIDYNITGRLARFGRGGMIEDISERLLREFAGRLQSSLSGGVSEKATALHETAEVPGSAAGEPEAVPPPTEAVPASSAEQPTQPFEQLGAQAPASSVPEPSAPEPPSVAEPSPVPEPSPAPEPRTDPEPTAGPAAPPVAPEPDATAGEPAPPPVAPEPDVVAEAAAARPPAEPAPPPPPPETPTPPAPTPHAAPPPPPPPPPPPEHEMKPAAPPQGLSLLGSAALDRVRRNPKPLLALAGGLIVLRMVRRRR